MNTLQKTINNSQVTLGKARELIIHICMENSTWINLGVKEEDIEKAEKLLKDIEKELGNITALSIQAIPSNLFNEGASSFLEDSVKIAFFDLNEIYNDLKNIKKNIKTKSDQRNSVKSIEKHFNQFIDDYKRIKVQLEHVLVGKNKNYKVKKRRRYDVK